MLEVNPRASRTVPFVAKAIGVPIARIAARLMAGETLADFGLEERSVSHVAVKEAVFPFARFPGVDVILGPEMKSTGEVMGLDQDFGRAFAKAQLAAGGALPESGRGVHLRAGPRQAERGRARPAPRRARLLPGRDARDGAGPARGGPRGRDRQQGAGRPAAHRRRAQGRSYRLHDQHHREREIDHGQLRDAPDGAPQECAVRHHHRGGERDGSTQSPPSARRASDVAPLQSYGQGETTVS